VVITSIVVEVWISSWWNDRGHVRSGRDFRAPVDYARSHPSHRAGAGAVVRAPVAPRLA
jgi:hypothetical protein